jgi:hypothetical protein
MHISYEPATVDPHHVIEIQNIIKHPLVTHLQVCSEFRVAEQPLYRCQPGKNVLMGLGGSDLTQRSMWFTGLPCGFLSTTAYNTEHAETEGASVAVIKGE